MRLGDLDLDPACPSPAGLVAVAVVQLDGCAPRAGKSFGKAFPGLAPVGQLHAALGDELVFVLLDRGLLFGTAVGYAGKSWEKCAAAVDRVER